MKKTILITGASKGLGLHMANFFAEKDFTVVAVARSEKELENKFSSKKNVIHHVLDISKKDSIQNFKEFIKNNQISIDILVNNAAIFEWTPLFEENETNNFEKNFETNVFGTYNMTKLIAEHMKKSYTHGSIINIGSINGDNFLGKNLSGYGSSKAAVSYLTKTLCEELAEHNIRINCINPGIFEFEGRERPKEILEKIPLKSFGHPNDLCELVYFLSDNEKSRYITGSIFTIDGGASTKR